MNLRFFTIREAEILGFFNVFVHQLALHLSFNAIFTYNQDLNKNIEKSVKKFQSLVGSEGGALWGETLNAGTIVIK